MKDALKIHFFSEPLQTIAEETTSELFSAEIIMKDQLLVSKRQPVTEESDEPKNQK